MSRPLTICAPHFWETEAVRAAAIIRSRARAREFRSCAELDRLLALLPQCRTVSEMLAAIEQAFVITFAFPLAIVMPDGNCVVLRHHSAEFTPDADEMTAAVSAIATGRSVCQLSRNGAGYSHFLPLATWKGIVGALGFKSSRRRIAHDKWLLIQTFANQTAMAFLWESLQDHAGHANVASEADGFRKVLLNSIAHNVRTPLASIIGVLSTLQEDHALLNREIRGDLLDTARQEAERLNRLLGNLLDLSRLEAGAVKVRADPCDVQDVVGAALEQLGDSAHKRPIGVIIAPDLPPVRMDFVLIVQVLVNVLDNAFKYSPVEAPVSIEANLLGDSLRICISDEGDGIPEPDLALVFEKFNRAGRTGETGGIGLGLSICRGLIEAHRGKIWAERRIPRGTAVIFHVPLRPETDE